MMQLIERGWFVFALILVLLAGFFLHDSLDDVADAVPRKFIVAAVLFLMSFTLDSSMMGRALRRPKAVVLATLVNYGLLPLTAWIVAFMQSREDIGFGVIILASVPSTLASAAVWTRRAGGNDAVALLATMVTNFSCFLVTPLLIELMSGKSFGVDIMKDLVFVVLLPIVIGQLLRRFELLGHWASEHKKALGAVAQCGILAIVLVGSVRCGEELAKGSSGNSLGPLTWTTMLVSVIGIHLAMLYLGHLLGSLWNIPREDRIAIGFSGSQKTLMIPVYLVSQFEELGIGGLVMLPIVAYHFCQLILDTFIADWLSKRGGSPGAEESQQSGSPKITEIAEPAEDPEPPQDE